MKFGQFIECIFFEKSYTKYDRQTNHRRFSRKSKLSVFLSHQSEHLYSFFIVCLSRRLPKYFEIKGLTSCFHHTKLVWKKTERGLEIVSLPHFLDDFEEKYFLYSINWPDFIARLPFSIPPESVWKPYFLNIQCALQLFVTRSLTS